LLASIYIFVVINSINYQDGIDGLAGGLSVISLIGFIILSLFLNNNFTLITSLIFLGAILSFLIFNFPPAKIFMGDSGAYSLGFALTVLAISFAKPYNIYSALSPIFIIGLPVFDGVFSNVRRIFYGKSIFFGDRNHFYDKLLRIFSIRKTLLISYSLQILSVIIGLIIYLHV
jgi:UDP-GlcNAc:undecaprenyl-phosphate GlcNAc-1-phosphate transferase